MPDQAQSAQAAPMGVSPVTGPTPNRGFEAAGLQQLGSALKQLERLVPLLGASSEIGIAVLKALTSLGKFVPPGSVTPAADANNAQQAMMQATQNNAQMQALRQQQTQGGAAA